MFRKQLFACILFLSTTLTVSTQTTSDSLQKATLNGLEGTELVDQLIEYCWTLKDSDPELASEFGFRAIQSAREINYPKGLAQAYNDLGIIYQEQGLPQTALNLYKTSLHLRDSLQDKNGAARLHLKIGVCYQQLGLNDDALESDIRAIKMFEELNERSPLASARNNLALLYKEMGKITEAETEYRKVIKAFDELGDEERMAGTMVNLGGLFFDQNENDSSQVYYFKALEILRRTDAKEYLATTVHNVGISYLERGNYKEASPLLNEAYTLRVKGKDRIGQASSLTALGQLYLETGRIDSAEIFFRQALVKSAESKALKESIKAAKELATLFETTGNYQEASGYRKTVSELEARLFNLNRSQQAEELRVRYDLENKEGQIKLLDRENEIKRLALIQEQAKSRTQRLFLFSIFSVLLLAGVGFYFWQKAHQQTRIEKQKQEDQKLRFRAIVEAEEAERKRVAAELHDGLGQVLSTTRLNIAGLETVITDEDPEDRKVYETALSLIDEACDEVRSISHAMMPGALTRLGLLSAMRELSSRINQSGQIEMTLFSPEEIPRMDEQKEIAIYRIFQEISNNMIRHSEASRITVDLNLTGNRLHLQIRDNGKGMDTEVIKTSKGLGWSNILSRVALFNGEFTINSEVGKGTELQVII